MRERLEAAPAEPGVRGCHAHDGSAGLRAREFDAIGKWRDERRRHADRRVRGACPTARSSRGWRACARLLLERREQFVTTVTEKLLTYALGRGDRRLRPAGGPPNRARRRGRRLPLVVAHSRHRQEHAVSDAEVRSHDHHQERPSRGGRSCAASARPSRCRCSTAWSRR